MYKHTLLAGSINLTVMFLECGKKLEYPERIHTYMMRTWKLYAERPEAGI